MTDNNTKPFNDFTPASKVTADINAVDLAIEYTLTLPDGESSKYYALERTYSRDAALSAAYTLRRIFGGHC